MVVSGWADPDGWCGLGDLARQDDDGYLYLGARLDGMINTGAYHVSVARVGSGRRAEWTAFYHLSAR
jgi:acyl-coenzyme A synthetase/AMP-(fatty) acid ligase